MASVYSQTVYFDLQINDVSHLLNSRFESTNIRWNSIVSHIRIYESVTLVYYFQFIIKIGHDEIFSLSSSVAYLGPPVVCN